LQMLLMMSALVRDMRYLHRGLMSEVFDDTTDQSSCFDSFLSAKFFFLSESFVHVEDKNHLHFHLPLPLPFVMPFFFSCPGGYLLTTS
jgi:hypothetical protein